MLKKLCLATFALASITNAALMDTFVHTYASGGDPNAVIITLRVFNGQPGGRFLWEYTVENNSFDPNPATSNGFSGFELFLPSPIAEIADINPHLPDWE